MELEENEAPKRRGRRPKPQVTGEQAQAIVDALITRISQGAPQQRLDEQAKVDIDKQFKSQAEKYHQEPHFWVTIHHNGDDDKVETEFIGAAGVNYTIKKGQRVLLPQSAVNCLGYAVQIGLDHGNPLTINGKKYLRKIQKRLIQYTIEPQVVSPDEAREWRMNQERLLIESQDLVPLDGGNPMDDLQQVG